MELRTIHKAALAVLAAAMIWQSGCSSSSPNTVVVTVVPTATGVIAGTVQTFTATVTGSTTLTSKWTCSYTYTPAATTSTPNPTQQTVKNCSSGDKMQGGTGTIGTWTSTDTVAPNVLTYTAPSLSNFPNPVPTITFTATADAAHNKTGTAVVVLDSGIRVAVTPSTATVPVGLSPAQAVQFTPSFLNVSPANANPQWQVMQPVANNTTDFPNGTSPDPRGKTCSPKCGSISAQGVFTAPATMPTDTSPDSSGSNATTAAKTVYVVVWSASDPNHYAIATITLVEASTNPITFTGIHPTTIPAGGVLQDIFLDAKNLLNTTTITFTPAGNNQSPQVINASNIFTIPITSAYCTPSASGVTPVVTCDASIMTRIRLTAQQLATAGTAQITVNGIPDPNNAGQTTSISYPLNLVYASPALVAAVPDSYPQGTNTQFATDGGYYGGGNSPIVNLLFNGTLNLATSFNARQFIGPLEGSQTQSPGLYPVSIVSNAPQQGQPPFNPPPYPIVTTNVAVQPVFSNLATTYSTTATPQVFPPNIPLQGGANAMPSSIAVNSTKGYAVVTEQGANAVEIINFVANPSLSGRFMPQVASQVVVGNQPTSVAIDDQIDLSGAGFAGQDLGVVVNSADSTLTLMALPSGQIIGSPISLSGLVQLPTGTTAPTPYSVGVDPITHYAVVAFSNAFVGFIVDVNPNPSAQPPACFVPTQKVPCAIASVSMNTGANPQIVMQPGVPVAYVTPGGSVVTGGTGVTSVVNLLLTNNSVPIAAAPNGAVRTNNVVTITTPTANGLNPSTPGTVLIAGVSPADLNGTYNVTSATTYTFTYTSTGPNETGGGGTVTYGNPYYTFSLSGTTTGAAINSVTRMFAFADPNAATLAPQIGFIRTLDQSVTSLYLTRGSCNGCTPTPSGAPETGVRSVAWDPFTNVLVAYNPQDTFDEISLINPGGPTATGTQSPYRIIAAIPTGQIGTGSFTPAGSTSAVTVYGPMVYDPKTNLVLAANAGSNTLTYLDLDPQATFKKANIRDVIVTSGGVASGQPPLAGTTGAPNPLPKAVCDPSNPTNIYASCFPQSVTVGQAATLRILGQGFLSGGTPIVRLDGNSTGITITNSTDSELDVSVAASRLAQAHDFALDVVAGSVNTNTRDLFAVSVLPLSTLCSSAVMPEAVAIDGIANVAVVTNYGCNNVSFISMDSTNAHNYGVPYGTLLATVNVGTKPIGVDVIPRLGYAVVANNGDGTASIIQYGSSPFSAKRLSFTANSNCATAPGGSTTDVCVGITPTGVGIDQDRALALVANSGGNSVSAIDLTALFSPTATAGAPPTMNLVATSGPPTAIAIDPNRSVAVVTNIQNSGTTGATGGLDVLNLSTTPPSKTTTASINSLTANPTGIVYDPAVSPALFYAASTQENAIYSFNPDSGNTSLIRVGVNPYSLAYNYQTGTMVSVNTTANTMSVIDAVNAPIFSTRETLGVSSQSQFAIAIDQFTNTAVMADQNNDRLLIVPVPK